MTTALQIVEEAMAKIVLMDSNESSSAEDATHALDVLNTLVDSWAVESLYAYTSSDVSASLSSGTQSLAIGPGQALNCTRPIRLEEGCYVTVGTLDYPLQVLRDDGTTYRQILLKNLPGPWPSVCWYDGGSPTGTVFFWPVGACTVHLRVLTQLSQFADLSTNYTLTPGTKRALVYSLAEELAPDFNAPLHPVVTSNAAKARRLLKRANVRVPQLETGGRARNPVADFYSGL